jgi:hypothetical protein
MPTMSSARRQLRPGRWALAVALLLSLSLASDALAITWGANVAITGAGSGWAWPGSLAVSSSTTAHVAYEQAVLGSWGVYYRRTTNSGTSWSPPVRLSRSDIGEAGSANVEAYGSAVDAVWLEGDDTLAGLDTVVMYRRSADAGVTWSDAVALTPPQESAGMPRVARRGSLVVLTWTNEVNGRVYARASTNGGATWSARILLATTTRKVGTRYEGFPVVAIGTGVVYVAYYSASKTLRIRRSTNSGSTWTSAAILATNGSGWTPSLAASGSTVVLGYAAVTSTDSWAVIRRSTTKGVSWGSAVDVGGRSSAPSFSPVVSVRGTRWMLAFERCTSSSCTTSDAWYRASTNAGSTWASASRVSVRHRSWEAPTDVDVATKTLVVYTDSNRSAGDVDVRQGS